MAFTIEEESISSIDSGFGDFGNFRIYCKHCQTHFEYVDVNLDKEIAAKIVEYACNDCYNNHKKSNKWIDRVDFDKEIDYFEVFKIVDHKITNNKREFLTCWVGFPWSENSWEPEQNFDHCLILLKEYLIANNLEATEIEPKVGASSIATKLNPSIWATLKQIESFVKYEILRNGGFDRTISISTNLEFGISKSIHLVDIGHHAICIYHIAEEKTIIVADGSNETFGNDHLLELIRNKAPAKTELIQLEFDAQVGVDHCAASACQILLEFLRASKQNTIPKILISNARQRARIIKTLHKGKSQQIAIKSLVAYKNVIVCPTCNKTFRDINVNKSEFLN